MENINSSEFTEADTLDEVIDAEAGDNPVDKDNSGINEDEQDASSETEKNTDTKAEPDEKIEVLKSEYDALKAERDDYYEQFLMKSADFDNYRKRILKEFAEIRFEGFKEFAIEIIEVFDNFAQAIDVGRKNKDFDSFFEGITMIEADFKKRLKKFEIEEMDAAGQPFDPQIHQALFMEESKKVKVDTVGEVLQAGYKYRDRILREARVKVIKPIQKAKK